MDVVGVCEMGEEGFSGTHTGKHEQVLWFLQFVCLGGPIFSLLLILFSSANFLCCFWHQHIVLVKRT